MSNNLPAGTAGTGVEVSNWVMAGHPMAISFAEQIPPNWTRATSRTTRSAMPSRGSHLYGGKVVRPEAVIICDADVTVV